jgi:hypothetical protein
MGTPPLPKQIYILFGVNNQKSESLYVKRVRALRMLTTIKKNVGSGCDATESHRLCANMERVPSIAPYVPTYRLANSPVLAEMPSTFAISFEEG